jgi:phosphoribosyl 1,2-cyclic phosphodiesterase
MSGSSYLPNPTGTHYKWASRLSTAQNIEFFKILGLACQKICDMKDTVFELAILGSGSAGNSALITTENCRILVDIGFSARQICQRLTALGVAPDSLDAILLTHEHGDHTAGLDVFSRKFKVPIYCNRLTAEALRGQGVATNAPWTIFCTGSSFTIRDLDVQTFYVPHDAVDPVGFIASSGYGSIGFLTDLGFATKLVHERIREVHTLVVETNHDERKLQDDPKRPWSVKQRILSRHGHLSNHAAATLVANIAGGYLERVILGHLSRDCNTQELALGEMERLGLDRLELFCAQQHEVSPRFSIGRTLPEITNQDDLAKIAEQVDPVAYHQAEHYHAQYTLNLQWDAI